ncbi:MAG: PAS domain S-box protein [Raineya sp.]|jgi:PAS domain S-box-containing protein|nr:PAS domain S-box protein [Raineya sp.]
MTQEFYSSLINYTRLTNEVLDIIKEGFLVINHQKEIIKVNKTFLKYIGLSEDEVLGRSFFSTIESHKLDVYKDMIQKASRSQRVQEEVFYLSKNNSWFRAFLYPFEAGYIFVLRDITDKKKQEEVLRKSEGMLKAILNSTSDINILVDREGKILSFNKAADESCKILYNQEMQEGQNIFDYASSDAVDTVKYNFKKVLNGMPITSERELIFPNGTKLWVQTRMFPVFNEEKEVWAVSFNYTNIDKIKKQNASLEEIAYIQSHTIRRPLSSILGLIDIVDKSKLDDENAKLFEYIKQAAQELDTVIHAIVKKTES